MGLKTATEKATELAGALDKIGEAATRAGGPLSALAAASARVGPAGTVGMPVVRADLDNGASVRRRRFV